jgi:hypothetical protein
MSYESCPKHIDQWGLHADATNGCEQCEAELVENLAHTITITITYMPRPLIGLEEKLRKADSFFLERLLDYLAAS